MSIDLTSEEPRIPNDEAIDLTNGNDQESESEIAGSRLKRTLRMVRRRLQKIRHEVIEDGNGCKNKKRKLCDNRGNDEGNVQPYIPIYKYAVCTSVASDLVSKNEIEVDCESEYHQCMICIDQLRNNDRV